MTGNGRGKKDSVESEPNRCRKLGVDFLTPATHIWCQQDPPRLGRCFGSGLRTPAGFLFFELFSALQVSGGLS
jgi:hypothetical protein